MPVRMSKVEFARATGTRKPRKAAKPPALVTPASSLVLTVTLPVVVVSEMNRRDHWAVVRRRTTGHKDSVFAAFLEYAFPKWIQTARFAVTLTRIGGKHMDRDNLAGSFKGVQDGVALALCIDDGDPNVQWSYAQVGASTGPQGIEIRIEATEAQR